MRILNATPHAIALIGRDGLTRIIDRSGRPARIETVSGKEIGEIDTIPLHAPSRFVRIVGLPENQEDTVVVVSQIVAIAVAALMPERTDVVYPATGQREGAKRNAGSVVSVERLIRAI